MASADNFVRDAAEGHTPEAGADVDGDHDDIDGLLFGGGSDLLGGHAAANLRGELEPLFPEGLRLLLHIGAGVLGLLSAGAYIASTLATDIALPPVTFAHSLA